MKRTRGTCCAPVGDEIRLTPKGRSCRTLPAYATVAVVLGVGGPALAFEAKDLFAISAGPVVLHPRFQFGEEFNDNLFYSQNNKQNDFLSILTPSLNLRLGRPEAEYGFDLTYSFIGIIYAKNPVYNANNHELNFTGFYNGSRFHVQASADVQYLTSIYGGLESFSNGYYGVLLENLNRIVPNVNGTVTYDLSDKTSTYVRMTYNATEFLKEILLPNLTTMYSNNAWKGYWGAQYKPAGKVGLFAEGYYGESAMDPTISYYPKPEHFDSVGGFLGVRGDFTSRIHGEAKVGYENVYNSTVSFGDPVASVTLADQITEKLSASVGYARQMNAPVYGGYTAGSSMTPYISDALTGQLVATLGTQHPVRLTLNGNYSRNANSTTHQNVTYNYNSDFITVGLHASYQFTRWAALSGGYDYTTSSSSSNHSYDVNRVSLNLMIGYF